MWHAVASRPVRDFTTQAKKRKTNSAAVGKARELKCTTKTGMCNLHVGEDLCTVMERQGSVELPHQRATFGTCIDVSMQYSRADDGQGSVVNRWRERELIDAYLSRTSQNLPACITIKGET